MDAMTLASKETLLPSQTLPLCLIIPGVSVNGEVAMPDVHRSDNLAGLLESK
jgi:hypothetical protein